MRDTEPKGSTCRSSREGLTRNGSPEKTDRCDSLDIRTRCDELRRLSEDELLSGMETAHGTERAALLDVLLYLIEFDRRRFYLARGFGSLFDFCMETYRYSRSAAWRRISAARCLARFPRIGGMLITGELTLSVISMISGIMTPENAGDVLRRVRGKSFRDAELLVARHRPERVLRDRIKPVFVMSPDPARGAPRAESISSSDGISPGCVNATAGGDNANSGSDVGTKCTVHRTSTPDVGSEKFPKSKLNFTGTPGAGNLVGALGVENTSGVPGAAEPERVVVKKKFKIEFAVDPEFMRDLERAQSLLSTKYPKRLGLEKLFGVLLKKYLDRHDPERRIKKRSRRGENNKKQSIEKGNGPGEVKEAVKKRTAAERTRHIQQSVRDEVFVRDGGRCTFTGKNGKRCNETWNLEIDHIIPYAKGGDHLPENLRLLCAQHNRLAAEDEYGAAHMKKFYRRE